MGALRVNRNVLRQQEAAAVGYFVARLPAWCTPDQLTALSIAGAFVAGLSLICCWASGWFVLAVLIGLALNWFGDSLDGALARVKNNERPRIGYLLDRGADLVSLTAIIIGLGLSPYLSLFSALMLLLVYYAHTIYILLRNVIDGIHVIGLIGIGATEGRILIGAWAAFAQLAGPDIALARIGGILLLDIFYGALFAGALAMFVVSLLADIRRIESAEAGRKAGAGENIVPIARPEAPRPRAGRGQGEDGLAERGGFAPIASRNTPVPL